MKFFRRIDIFAFLLFLIFPFSISQDSDTIILTKNGNQEFILWSNEKSKTYYLKGEVDTSQKYICIKISPSFNEFNLPSIFISKKKEINEEQKESVYSFYNNEGNIFAIPISYFNENNVNGFYINFICYLSCTSFTLNIKYENNIELSYGDKLSFYSSDELVMINISGEKKSNEMGFMLSGGNKDDVSMRVDGYSAEMVLPNLHYLKQGISEGNKVVSILMNKANKKFTFKTKEIINEDEQIILGDYDQYFNLNMRKCFSIKFTNEGDKDINNLYNLIFESENELSMSYYIDDGNSNKKEYTSQNKGGVISGVENIYYSNNYQNICFESNNINPSIIHIQIQKVSENIRMPKILKDNIIYNIETKNKNKISVYTYDRFYENVETQGINLGIRVYNSNIKIYKDVCTPFPYCNYTQESLQEKIKNENYNSKFETLYIINNYASITLNSNENYPSISNNRNVFIILCEEDGNNLCKYDIQFYPIQEIKLLEEKKPIMKYLRAYEKENGIEDKYKIGTDRSTKVIVNLIVESGDAYIYPDSVIDGCKFEEYHIYSNEKRILNCENSNMNLIEYKFNVRSNNKASVYSIVIEKKAKDEDNYGYPIGMTILESIDRTKEQKISIISDSNINNDRDIKQIHIFNSINCDISVNNEMTDKKYDTKESDLIADIINGNPLFTYKIKASETYHIDDNHCLFYRMSTIINKDNYYMIIPEAKPFRFSLNKDISKIQIGFPYAVSNPNDKVYLSVNLFNNLPVELKINIGYSETKTYTLLQSQEIVLVDGNNNNLHLNRLINIKIVARSISIKENEESVIDFKIKTSSEIPYIIKLDEYFIDIINNNSTQYYIAEISNQAKGEIAINFKRGTGLVFARLINQKEAKEEEGWNRRLKLPGENDTNLLKYDFYEQRLILSGEDTKKCDNYCYLIFGVEMSNDVSNVDSELTNSYSIYFKYYDIDEVFNNYISLQNNEFIYEYIKSSENNYYKYLIHSDVDEIIIDFKSDYCIMNISLNNSKFNDEEVTKSYESNGNNEIIKIKKEEILSNKKIKKMLIH